MTLPGPILQAGPTCPSGPAGFAQMLQDLVSGGNMIDPFMCPFIVGGVGIIGFGALVVAGVFFGLRNWSESNVVPFTWLVLSGGVVFGWLPGEFLGPIAGIITLITALIFLGSMYYLRRRS